ncbi:alginate lyase family protein [Anaerocolumna xylanovorans]|uniref:Heparinase II/III-like protein n=1 Tax=Anaerocolumna xylanovorans DSM 12503 TaxID=1121345 RepID=A0A1M7Y5A2_9FIRM|nr:alginate lyase family protein [Anaerocolumna xylanovorans]SHO47599.1 Heparinase II/III-like protein [Anaerocolumna xylanovorans DSM 12503]
MRGNERLSLFWCQNTGKELADLMKREYEEETGALLVQAEELLGNSFTFREHWEMERTHKPVIFEKEIDWKHVPDGDAEWVYALNRHTFLLILAKAWYITGDLRFGEKYAELIESWLVKEPLTEENKKSTWRSIEAGIRCEYWLRSLQLMAGCPVVTDTLKGKMEDSLRIHGDYLVKTNETFHRISNWGVLQNHGLFLLGLYFNEKGWIEEAVSRLQQEMQQQVFPDGTHWEQSPMYHGEVLHCFLDTYLHARRFRIAMGKEFRGRLKSMVYALAVLRRPKGEIPCQSDSDGIEAGDLVAMGSILFRDRKLKYLAGNRFCSEVWWLLGIGCRKEYQVMAEEKPGFTSYALTDSGNYVLRDSFTENSGYVRFHCGTMGSGHGHADLLHVDFAAEGEDILIDSGRYTYVEGEERAYLKSPKAHNTVVVDGMDFTECRGSWNYGRMAAPIKGEHCFSQYADYVWGAHLGYLDIGLYTERRVIYLKNNLLCIIDSFRGKGWHDYVQYWHIQKDCSLFLNEGKGTIIGKNVDGELLCLKGEGKIADDICSTEYNRLEKNQTLIQNWKAEGSTSMITIITADKKDQGKPLKAKLLPVTLQSSKKELTSSQAEAIQICHGEEEFVLILCYEEVINGVDLVSAGGYSSYGKVLVFSKDNPAGQCLQY